MTLPEEHYGVWLRDLRIGTLVHRGDHTRFRLTDSYLSDPNRPVLGLRFEQDLRARHSAALRLPPWFSNLLPEGALRDWIAAERHVSAKREMELLIQVGHDLPGAVRVRHVEPADEDEEEPFQAAEPAPPATVPWRFSLAGVALKFSMLLQHDRLTMPATGVGGDWIVKLPDRAYADVPRNEHAMMRLAGAAGIEIPEVRLVHRDQLEGLPPNIWPPGEDLAYAVRRFDRGPNRELVHIEDLAQVRGFYPDDKYTGNYETVAALIYRGHDVASLQEFARRLTFSILISNGDAHLKNWSLLYADARIPRISPAYDLVSTRFYMGNDEDMGLPFGGVRQFERLRLSTFDRLESRLGVRADLAAIGRSVIDAVRELSPMLDEYIPSNDALLADVQGSIRERSRTLLSS
ncbi:type II toxin-antitoxin system HipA family toxin [Dactylosporangium sp. CA-052675]|uniref:type II toxin-antitoxin system HipA family toxin n=1 Tax=Dactylosporangium sp. CA-052675 TaxID=3239927 RepID=UPI003D8C2D3E